MYVILRNNQNSHVEVLKLFTYVVTLVVGLEVRVEGQLGMGVSIGNKTKNSGI